MVSARRTARPPEAVYAVAFLDAIHYHVRSEGQIVKKAVYIVIGIDLGGKKDVLGMWSGENESAKFWATVLNGLKNRGADDIFIACTDNLTGYNKFLGLDNMVLTNRFFSYIINQPKRFGYYSYFGYARRDTCGWNHKGFGA